MSNRVIVIGIGEAGLDELSGAAHRELAAADVIYGGPRHLAMSGTDGPSQRIAWSKDLSADIEHIAALSGDQSIVVLASGDPMLHGIGVRLVERLGIENLKIMPAPSAFSLATARLGWPLGDPMVKCISVHALPFESVLRVVQPGVRLLILSRDGETPAQLATMLTATGYAHSRVSVLERLGGKHEQRTDAQASTGFSKTFDNLNTVAVTCLPDPDTRALSMVPGLPDDAYIHDNIITKQEVRAITLAALAPTPDQVLWDVGAGNGTIAIEWLRAEPAAFALAFEKNPERVANIKTNARQLGTPMLRVIQGHFPPPVDGLEPSPDAVFIGGGMAGNTSGGMAGNTSGGMAGNDDLIGFCMSALSPGGRLVANAVTLQAQAALTAAYAKWGGDLVNIAIACATGIGPHQAMKPAIDVLQWRGRKQ